MSVSFPEEWSNPEQLWEPVQESRKPKRTLSRIMKWALGRLVRNPENRV